MITHAMTHCDDIGPYAEILIPRKNFFTVMSNVRSYTQAPLHFVLMFFILKLAHDYDSILFWIRLPSLVYWLIGLFCYFYVFQEHFGKKHRGIVVFLMTLSLISWRGLVESWQSYNYPTLSIFVPLFFHFFTSTYQLQPDWLKSPHHWKKLGLGFLLGATLWMNYATAFLLGAGAMALTLWIFLYRTKAERKPLFKEAFFVALGCYVSFEMIWKFSLKYQNFRGIPGWPGAIAPDGFLPKIGFWFQGWFYIIKNVTTFLPWEADGPAVIFCVVIAVGFILQYFKPMTELSKKFYFMLASFVVIWTYLCFFKHFPMAPTRHTYIFQFPVLMLIGYSLSRFSLSSKVYYVASALCVALFALNFHTLCENIENKIDPKYLLRLADENPDATMMGINDTVTWDTVLLTVERPDLKNRLLLGESYWREVLNNPSINHLILISHRRGLDKANYDDLEKSGYHKFVALKDIPPVGATELSSTFNGGNGFYVYDVQR